MNKRPKETMEKNKNKMSNRDKVAMLLTSRGFSLEEGMMMYDKMKESEKKYLVTIDSENDVAVWMERYTTDEDGETINLTIWLNYRKDFCDNYALAGAVALNDEELAIDGPEEGKAFMDFFRRCKETEYSAPAPLLPEELRYIFTMAALTDYMECDTYAISNDTAISVKTNAHPVF